MVDSVLCNVDEKKSHYIGAWDLKRFIHLSSPLAVFLKINGLFGMNSIFLFASLTQYNMTKCCKLCKYLLLLLVFANPITAISAVFQEENEKPHIVFLISEDPLNYQAHETIPKFADRLTSKLDFRVTVLQGRGDLASFHFPGLEILAEADLVITFFRRIALPHEQMKIIKGYLKDGKPLIGIRTANHAFSVRDEVPDGYESWWGFVPDILGCENRGYGAVKVGTEVAVTPEAKGHDILKGFEPDHWHSIGNIYHVAPLLDKQAVILLTGKAEDKVEPIAWARFAERSRVFYTSLGHPEDFEEPQFSRLLINAIYWAIDTSATE